MPLQHYTLDTYRADKSIGYLLKHAHLLLMDRLEPLLVADELTFTQWVVLMHLREGLAVNPAVLCVQLRHDSGALTRVIDQLEQRGLVRRERSRRDRRSVQLHLTEAGRSLIEGFIPSLIERLNSVLADFSRAEVGELIRLLGKLIGALEHGEQA